MADRSSLQTIIEWVGDEQSGKTTLAKALVQWFLTHRPDDNILVIDGDPSATLSGGISQSIPQLKELVNQWLQKAAQHHDVSLESIDWHFGDLLHSLPDYQSLDILTIGKLPDPMPIQVEQWVAYGLSRLMAQYHFIVVDESVEWVRRLLPKPECLKTIVVVAPDSALRHVDERLNEKAFIGHGYIVLNRLPPEGELPEPLASAVLKHSQQSGIPIIARFPEWETNAEKAAQLPGLLHDCLYRIDLPLRQV